MWIYEWKKMRNNSLIDFFQRIYFSNSFYPYMINYFKKMNEIDENYISHKEIEYFEKYKTIFSSIDNQNEFYWD